MFGRFVSVLVLAGILFGVGAWSLGLLPVAVKSGGTALSSANAETPRQQEPAAKPEPGGPLYKAAAAQPAPKSVGLQSTIAAEPIVISNCRLGLIDKLDVPAQRDGVLMFIGIEMKEGEELPMGETPKQVLDGGKVKKFRRLVEGDEVTAAQLIARVDDTLAQAETQIKVAKVEAAKADRTASEKTRDEAEKRYQTQLRLLRTNGAASPEDVRGAELTWIRYQYEVVSKAEAIKVAEQELKQAEKTLDMYDIRSKVSGKVKSIIRHEGEAVKNLDTVIQVQNYDRLRADGTVDTQYARALAKGLVVRVEPTVRERPLAALKGQRLEINGVAVSNNPQKPLIVAASEDATVGVWDARTGQQVQTLVHPAPVRAIACTPAGAGSNYCLTGAADGAARLWDLDGNGDRPVRVFDGLHRGGIRSVAFSPDGKICATGGEDNEIRIWNTTTGELQYTIPAHKNWVTGLTFIPQSRLISVGRDDSVRIWDLRERGADLVQSIRRHSHDVTHLGVSADGNYIFDEQGKEMGILAWANRTQVGRLQNPPSLANNFRTLAQFSPDQRLALTTTGSEGMLQLWRLDKSRNHELRQLVSPDHVAATCASFSPDGSFIVVGNKEGKVYLWQTPTKEEIDRQLTARITNIDDIVEATEGQVRITVEMSNEDHRLTSGDIVTLVAFPRAR